MQPAPCDEGDRVDDARVGQLGPGGLREVERVDACERFAAALGGLLAQTLVDLLLGHPFELAVVVEQTHGKAVLAGTDARYPALARRESAMRAHGLPLPDCVIEPGPWMTMNQKAKTMPQIAAVVPKIRPMMPLR
jgi:hypothetical protein